MAKEKNYDPYVVLNHDLRNKETCFNQSYLWCRYRARFKEKSDLKAWSACFTWICRGRCFQSVFLFIDCYEPLSLNEIKIIVVSSINLVYVSLVKVGVPSITTVWWSWHFKSTLISLRRKVLYKDIGK